jgi:twitching motility protein PilT
LQAVVTQCLLPNAKGPGRCLSLEVMVPNAAIRNLIREDKLHQIYSAMQMGQGESGMQTMNQALFDLFERGMITADDAMTYAGDMDELKGMMEGNTIGTNRAMKKGYR